MQLPFNNENVERWRDEPNFHDSADFDPQAVLEAKEKRSKFYLERFEKPKELTQWS